MRRRRIWRILWPMDPASPRPLHALLEQDDPAWPLVEGWIAAAQRPVQVLPAERQRGEQTLLALQVTTRSPLGAIALETAGILIDHGWLRILGAGGPGLADGLLAWNGRGPHAVSDPLAGALLVAHDILGGFFALNGGAFPGRHGAVHFFAPDRLTWEDLRIGYGDFVHWALNGDLATFYASLRWPGWEAEVRVLTGDRGLWVYPFLWAQGPPLAERSRRPVPMRELWSLQRDVARQIQGLPDGTSIAIRQSE